MQRVGVSFGRNVPASELVEFAKMAEEKGFDSVWVPEAWGRDAFLLAERVALATERIKVATGVVNAYSRSPALIAMSIATLDEISGGRAILGIGASSQELVEGWHGLRYEEPIKRVRECVEVVRKVLGGGSIFYRGSIFRLNRFKLAFKPLRKHIPIYLAALSPKMLRLAGELADGAILYMHPLQYIPRFVQELKDGAMMANREPDAVDVSSYIVTCVSRDGAKAKGLARRVIAYYVGSMGTSYRSLLRLCGLSKEASLIKGAWDRGDRSEAARSVTDGMLESLAIAGSPEECRAKLEEFRSAGIKLPVLSFDLPPGPSFKENVLEALDALAG